MDDAAGIVEERAEHQWVSGPIVRGAGEGPASGDLCQDPTVVQESLPGTEGEFIEVVETKIMWGRQEARDQAALRL